MVTCDYSVRYPRRRVQRSVVRLLGRALVPLLTRTTVTGREHFPAGGPLLVVGNHIATMEVVLMVVYAPWQLEMLGPGDVPPPPAMDAIARFYGYTPINRGSVDRAPLRHTLGVLAQGRKVVCIEIFKDRFQFLARMRDPRIECSGKDLLVGRLPVIGHHGLAGPHQVGHEFVRRHEVCYAGGQQPEVVRQKHIHVIGQQRAVQVKEYGSDRSLHDSLFAPLGSVWRGPLYHKVAPYAPLCLG